MRNAVHRDSLNRIIDANINRAKEGLRVCEEITRFILNNRSLTGKLKTARHKIETLVTLLPASHRLLAARKSLSDVGKTIYIRELKRRSLADIFYANITRVQESIRVLEEFTKLDSAKIAVAFKKIRYDVYEIERLIAQKLSAPHTHT